MTHSIRKWSDDTDATLQDCFASTDWNMFRDSANGIEENTTSVIGFINKCIDDVVPTVTESKYPNQKPLITDKPSNKQSVDTGLRLNPTTPALTFVGCGRA